MYAIIIMAVQKEGESENVYTLNINVTKLLLFYGLFWGSRLLFKKLLLGVDYSFIQGIENCAIDISHTEHLLFPN